jgi:hypothetical protein
MSNTNHIATIANRKTALELQLSLRFGTEMELTVRGLRHFTISADGDQLTTFKKVKSFLNENRSIVSWEVDYDLELDMSFAYFAV